MGGIQAGEKPSQWMARFRHTGGEWDREDVERWALFRQLPTDCALHWKFQHRS